MVAVGTANARAIWAASNPSTVCSMRGVRTAGSMRRMRAGEQQLETLVGDRVDIEFVLGGGIELGQRQV